MDASKDIVLLTIDHVTRSVRDGKDTVLFHVKVCTQA